MANFPEELSYTTVLCVGQSVPSLAPFVDSLRAQGIHTDARDSFAGASERMSRFHYDIIVIEQGLMAQARDTMAYATFRQSVNMACDHPRGAQVRLVERFGTERVGTKQYRRSTTDERDILQLAKRLDRELKTGIVTEDLAHSPIASIVFREVSNEALRWLADHPNSLDGLHSYDFENLVAELFDRAGFAVTLTARSKDRGVDLFATRHTSLGPLLYVVECKRYRRDRAVGPGWVRQLSYVVDREHANVGVLATTSFFSAGAIEEQREIPFKLTLRDQADIRRWLRGGITV